MILQLLSLSEQRGMLCYANGRILSIVFRLSMLSFSITSPKLAKHIAALFGSQEEQWT